MTTGTAIRQDWDFFSFFRMIVSILVTLFAGYVALLSYQIYILGLVTFVCLFIVAVRYPLVTLVIALLCGSLPLVFRTLPGFDVEYGSIGGGLNAIDVVMVAMLLATVWKAFTGHRILTPSVTIPFVLFGVWCLIEVLRNLPEFGLSAPGEFRYSYLPLAAMAYVGSSFPASRDRKLAVRVMLVATVMLPLFSVVLIGLVRGWQMGADNRFLQAHVHLGLLYGIILCFIARKYRLLRVSWLTCTIGVVSAVAIIVVDGHRSIWLAGTGSLVALAVLGELRGRFLQGVIGVAVLFGALAMLAPDVVVKLAEYLGARGLAFTNFEADPTARWRVAVWSSALDQILQSPFAGNGFGAYWYFYLTEFRQVVTVSPHSLYIQLLLKTGLVGLSLYLILMVMCWRHLRSSVSSSRSLHDPEVALPVLGLVVMVSSHLFYGFYALDYYTLIFLGLALSKASETIDLRRKE